ncbi:HD domain-containing protein [Jidongwangia harbinensis]|uniref:HD domain-containing protein n=1 Tax=Jidongwangia harbinensis TaxID=2878561 RepID=UPI001CD9767D|nr:HD domain-containing protein [Jidongwangia harbinensis]MCA2214877.1 HD domain-containing protein [Jidongwangia harbinensis]
MTGVAAEGTWNLTLHTPIGRLAAVVVLSSDDGVLRGVARDPGSDEEVPLRDIVLDGGRLTWAQTITKPMWLRLTFDVTISGDEMTGRSKAGRLPGSKVVGRRAVPVVAAAAGAGPSTPATPEAGPATAATPEAGPATAATAPGIGLPEEVAGVRIPRSDLVDETLSFARASLSEVLFHHVMRTFLFGSILHREETGTDYDDELTFLACLLHDLGVLRQYWTPEQRFEVDGADAAGSFLAARGLAAEKVDIVWDAIALHTVFGIALRKRPEIAIVSLGSGLDFAGIGYDIMPAGSIDAILSAFPRLGFKEEARANMIDMYTTKPAMHLHFPSLFQPGRVPGYQPPALVEMMLSTPFAT